ncbi:DNA cytosine methyltransferase [Pseudoalteromonas gelatinilytica]
MEKSVKVIDIFAGPGGLGEGFFSYKEDNGHFPFEGLISVEKDLHAHATLTLRAFYRLLIKNNLEIPDEYYQYADGEIDYPFTSATKELWEQANKETLQLEMGQDQKADIELFRNIRESNDDTSPRVLIGGPPCQAYSLVGRARNKGNKEYVPEEDHRHFLYKEYLSIMEIFSPDIFVMENVKGMLSSKVNGGAVFDQIIKDLECCSAGYSLYSLKTGKRFVRGETSPKDFILCSEDYGIPQNRHRVIILGIKKKNGQVLDSIEPLEHSQKVSVGDAIADLPKLRSPLSSRGKRYNKDSLSAWKENLQTGVNELIDSGTLDNKLVIKLKENLSQLKQSHLDISSVAQYNPSKFPTVFDEFVKDTPLSNIRSHESRPHMDSDLLRYFFCASFRDVHGRNARADDFPDLLAPDHKNWKSGKFVDRFKVQNFNSQSSTVTSHISKDGHYFIHSSAEQCRSLTVREAARIQSFPDSYQFMGKRTNQFHQVGNAVPPLLARQIANIVMKLLK